MNKEFSKYVSKLSPEQQKLALQQLKSVVRDVKTSRIARMPLYDHDWGEDYVAIGIVGDAHVGNKFFRRDLAEDLYDRFKAQKVRQVYQVGDLTDGDHMHKGQTYELYAHGADQQVDAVVKEWPKRRGMQTYFIGGNHDEAHWKHAGVDVGKQIEERRKDMTYLGLRAADIKLGKKTTLRLLHPGGGSAYAISYKAQKWAESIPGGNKPNIAAIGHYHKAEYLFYRNIHIFQAGTVEDQTNFMAVNNLSAHLGGWILGVHMKKNGEIDRLDQTFIPYY